MRECIFSCCMSLILVNTAFVTRNNDQNWWVFWVTLVAVIVVAICIAYLEDVITTQKIEINKLKRKNKGEKWI